MAGAPIDKPPNRNHCANCEVIEYPFCQDRSGRGPVFEKARESLDLASMRHRARVEKMAKRLMKKIWFAHQLAPLPVVDVQLAWPNRWAQASLNDNLAHLVSSELEIEGIFIFRNLKACQNSCWCIDLCINRNAYLVHMYLRGLIGFKYEERDERFVSGIESPVIDRDPGSYLEKS